MQRSCSKDLTTRAAGIEVSTTMSSASRTPSSMMYKTRYRMPEYSASLMKSKDHVWLDSGGTVRGCLGRLGKHFLARRFWFRPMAQYTRQRSLWSQTKPCRYKAQWHFQKPQEPLRSKTALSASMTGASLRAWRSDRSSRYHRLLGRPTRRHARLTDIEAFLNSSRAAQRRSDGLRVFLEDPLAPGSPSPSLHTSSSTDCSQPGSP